jgi:N-acetylmuramoyl-L-alanine amidase
LHMCRESNMSAVLTENLFISNKADADKLRQDAFINRIAQGHVVGLEKFLGLKKKQTAEPNTALNDIGVRFAVQVGSFASRANAEAMLKRVQAEGFEAFIKEQ